MLWPQSLKSLTSSRRPIIVRWLVAYTPSLLWAGLIFWFSSQSQLPTLNEPTLEWLWKKLAHFLVYAALYFWLWWGTGLLRPKQLKTSRLQFVLLTIVVLYAFSDEYHQSFVANRHPSLIDVGINFLGGATSAITLRHWVTKRV